MKTKSHISRSFSGSEAMRRLVQVLSSTGLPPEAEVIYSSRNKVARLNLEGEKLIIKEFGIPNIINRYVYTTLRKSKARRSYEHAEKLIGLGFSTGTPVAWIECRESARLGRSYYICGEIEGRDLRFLDRNPDTPELLPALAGEMGRLHRAGVWHKDFSPGNILYRREGGRIRFYYIDLNRMRFGVRSPRRLLGNFGMLAREEEVAAIGRLYARHSPFGLSDGQGEAIARGMRRDFLRRKPGCRLPGE